MGVSPLQKSRSFLILLATLALLLTSGPSGALGAPSASADGHAQGAKFISSGIYIVRMSGDPAVAYEGAIAGLKATAPQAGAKINPNAADVVKYTDHLKATHDVALKAVGASQKIYDYVFTNDAFAARLTADQANALAARKDVLSVEADAIHTLDTSSTPSFLGLDAAGGLWDQLGGFGHAGDGIIIGDVDSGIWPESLSFADRVDADGTPSSSPGAKRAYQQLPGWHGKCVPGEDFTATDCNQKLIGARYYNAGQGGNAGINADRPWEFNSVRDYNGHGTHTASTAGGNHGVMATGPAEIFGAISGMAPRARIAAYKALWSTVDGSTASGTTSDLAAAIDQAVADGVDVINYSVSGTQTNFADAVEISFLFAARAGVFVATSAGNSGPTSATVAHPSPWETTVAAGTHNRTGKGSVTLGNGVTYEGASVATAVGPVPIIDSVDAGLPDADPDLVELCYAASDNVVGDDPGVPTAVLDPAKVEGKIVLCKRGVIARVDKSKAVLEAGGVGMVMYNDPDSSLNADFHYVPSVHVDMASGLAIKSYIAGAAAPTATINEATIVFDEPAPFTASFSSRGPLRGAGGDLLKPDVIAPGQDVLAAVSPAIAGRNFDLLSGTSMSSPHVAGLAALLMDLHPAWSPMAVKSALMTTGYDVLDGGTPAPNTNPVLIFRQGAGHVQPNSAADPGLVYNSGFNDWLAFLCGQVPGLVNPSSCTALVGAGFSTDASDLNGASIAIGDLAGIQTVTRRVTNVGGDSATYTASVSGMSGITTVVEPSTLALDPGESASFTVTFTQSAAAFNAYTGGQLTWSDGSHAVRSPIVVRPVPIAAPAEISGTADGISYEVVTGFAGTLDFAARGLVPATETAASVSQDPDQTFDPEDPTGTVSFDIEVPAGTVLLRTGIDESTITPSGTDLDVFLHDPDGTLRAQAADGDSNELASFASPAAGTWKVYVHGFDTVAASADFTLYTWILGTSDDGNMTVPGPATATVAGTVPVDLSFTGLDPTMWYLGQVVYLNTGSVIGTTIVTVR
jgi:subtilisin family serine protease